MPIYTGNFDGEQERRADGLHGRLPKSLPSGLVLRGGPRVASALSLRINRITAKDVVRRLAHDTGTGQRERAGNLVKQALPTPMLRTYLARTEGSLQQEGTALQLPLGDRSMLSPRL